MKYILHAIIIATSTFILGGCSDYDDIALWNKVNDMESNKTTEDNNTVPEDSILKIELSTPNEIEILLNDPVEIEYTITGASTPTVDVYSNTNDAWIVTLTQSTPTSGIVNVLCHDFNAVTPVILFASVDNGPTSMVKINFTHPKIGSVITYTTTDGNPLEITHEAAFDVPIVSNTYHNGIGSIYFDGELTSVGPGINYTGCFPNVKSMTLPNTVTTIKEFAFYRSSIEQINFPSSIELIETAAFRLTNLKEVTIESEHITIQNASFAGSKVEFLDMSCTTDADWSLDGNAIGTFEDCKNLKEVKLGNIKILGYDTDNYTSTRIRGVFRGCTALESINLPEGLTKIGPGTFCDCTSLTSIRFPESLQIIDMAAFTSSGLNCDLFIPNNVHTIGMNAFGSCTNLKGHRLVLGYTTPRTPQRCELSSIGEIAFANMLSADNQEFEGLGFSEIWVNTAEPPVLDTDGGIRYPFGDTNRPTSFNILGLPHMFAGSAWDDGNTTFTSYVSQYGKWPIPSWLND